MDDGTTMITSSSAMTDDVAWEAMERVRASSGNLRFDVETITPDMAREIRRTVILSPREDRRAVETYANAMKTDGWVMNAQPIILDQNDQLIDGYLRLMAAEKAGVSFKSLIARGVSRDTLHTMDQHRRRRYTGVLEARGIANAGAVVRLMGRLIRIDSGKYGISTAPISWSCFDRVLQANPEIHQAVWRSEACARNALRSGVRNILFFMALRSDRLEDMQVFLKDFDLEVSEEQAQFRATRKLRMELAAQRSRARDGGGTSVGLTESEELGSAISAFNDAFDGDKTADTYIWHPERPAARPKAGRPRKAATSAVHAPTPNLGLPVMKGYQGLREGEIQSSCLGEDYVGYLGEELKDAHAQEGCELELERITLTPDLARKMLHFNTRNRKIQPGHVAMIARDIKSGSWMMNVQPICFTRNPFKAIAEGSNTLLLNGQHRLHACVRANMPIEVVIAWNVSEKAFPTFDIHAKRSKLADSSAGDDRVLKAAAKFMWRADQGHDLLASITPSATDLNTTLENHPALMHVFSDARRLKDFGSAGVVTYLLARIKEDYPDYYDEFFEIMKTGTDVEAGNPLGTWRSKILRAYAAKAKRADMLKLHLQAWEKYRDWRRAKDSRG